MNLPAVQQGNATPATVNPGMSISELTAVAKQVAASRLFPGVENEQAAFTLMLLCQAEGLHPINAMRRYHIIKGRPSMRADAMQAEFQRQGGTIRWAESSNDVCAATFTHPTHAPEGFTVTVKLAELAAAGVTQSNPNYAKWPRQMLRARAISEGVRAVLPGVVVGIYSDVEVEDMVAERAQASKARHDPDPIDVTPAQPPETPAGGDGRSYDQVIHDAVAWVNEQVMAEASKFGVTAENDELLNLSELEYRLHSECDRAGLCPKNESRKATTPEGRAKKLDALYHGHPNAIKKLLKGLGTTFIANATEKIQAEARKGDAYEEALSN